MSSISLSKQNYIMIKDAMNAIKLAECEDFVININDSRTELPFTLEHPMLHKIRNEMKYNRHSSLSLTSTIRTCQYYLKNTKQWHNISSHYEEII